MLCRSSSSNDIDVVVLSSASHFNINAWTHVLPSIIGQSPPPQLLRTQSKHQKTWSLSWWRVTNHFFEHVFLDVLNIRFAPEKCSTLGYLKMPPTFVLFWAHCVWMGQYHVLISWTVHRYASEGFQCNYTFLYICMKSHMVQFTFP